VTANATVKDVATTALEWSKVSEALSLSKAKVLVLLDACHSGLASQEAVVPNDEYAAELVKNGKTGMAVLAAAKGRQKSNEHEALGGGHGLFSYAIGQAFGKDRQAADLNGDGVIDLSELYTYTKHWVSTEAKQNNLAEQTPWLSHDEFIGQIPVL
jgi:uncharacterized caspase-like protein